MTAHNVKSMLLSVALAVALGACATGTVVDRHASPSAVIRYDSIHHPVLAREAMVVSQNALASEVGSRVLRDGGNAVDAAVAVGFALAVTLPRAGNLGGSGFMLIYNAATEQTTALDFRSAAPRGFDPALYRNEAGEIDYTKMTFGPMAPGVPGTVAGLQEAWQRFGSLPWARLVEPARRLAAEGIVVTGDLAYALGKASAVLATYPGSATAYLKPDLSSYRTGDRLLQPELAWSLALIRDEGAGGFYRGKIAERIVAYINANGGLIDAQDLAAYRVRERTPVEGTYRGHRIVTMPPVSAGGLTLVQMLNVLEHFPVADYPAGSAAQVHLLAEVMKRSAANRRIGIGDPDFADVATDGFTSPALAAELANGIDLTRATPVAEITPIDAHEYESRDTTHYSIVDTRGNAVAMTYTLGYSFGSGMAIPGTGILLDNQMRNFSHRDADHANAPAPGKRMVSTMTPVIVLDEHGELMMVTGTPGGSRIINVLLQLIVNVIDYDMNIAEATYRPRIYQGWRNRKLGVEPGFSADTLDLLRARGHEVEIRQSMGSTQSIVLRDGLLQGAADPRRPGALATGF